MRIYAYDIKIQSEILSGFIFNDVSSHPNISRKDYDYNFLSEISLAYVNYY